MTAESVYPTTAVDPEAGMSLVEVMFGMVLVVAFAAALLTVAIQQSSHRQTNQESSLALSAALDNIERIRAVPFATLPTLDGADFDVPGINGQPGGLRALASDPDGLPGELSVTLDPASTGGVSLYRVSAVVIWRGVARSRRIALETLVAERK